MDNFNPHITGNIELRETLKELRKNLLLYLENIETGILNNNSNILAENGKNFKYGIRLINKNGIIIGVNNAFCSLFNIEEKIIIGKSYRSIYDKNNNEDVEELLDLFKRNLLKPNIDYYFEKFIITKKGKSISLEGINFFIEPKKLSLTDNDTLLLTVFGEVPEENEIGNANSLDETSLHPPQDAIITEDLFGIINGWNIKAEKIYGYSANEIIGKSSSILFPRDRKNELKKIIQQVKNGEKIDNYETTNKKNDGTLVHVLLQISPVKNSMELLTGIKIISRDISEQKKTEIRLRKNEEMYRTLIETSPDAILLLDLNGKILMSNKQVAVTLRYDSIEEIQLQNIFSFFISKDRKRIFRDARKVIETGILKNREYTVKTRNGEKIPVEINASLILDMFGKPDGIIGVMRDISERKEAEEAIKNSELRFRSIWENSNDGMRLTNNKGSIVAVNKAFCTLVGLNERDLLGKPFITIFSNDDCDDPGIRLNEYQEKFINRDIKPYVQTNYKYWKPANVVLIESYSFIEFENGEPLLLGIFHDITDMKKNEEELRNAEKFAAIGKQAVILSHEIKSPLASIKMNIDILFNNLAIPESNQKSFQIVQKEIKRLEILLKNVLLYSRDLNLKFLPVDLEKLVDNIIDLMKPVLHKQNIIVLNYLANMRVKGDHRNLQTVFLHLIENSIESMPNGGIIEIYSQHHDDDSYSVFIKDNGSGISEKDKIFEPFFTTKSSGTGLGLSIAKNIIKQHNCDLSLVSSIPGETIFKILFPNNNLK